MCLNNRVYRFKGERIQSSSTDRGGKERGDDVRTPLLFELVNTIRSDRSSRRQMNEVCRIEIFDLKYKGTFFVINHL